MNLLPSIALFKHPMLVKNKWFLICLIGASTVGFLTYSLPIAEGDNILYLLSSISQGLSAIFTLLLAITIFGAQKLPKFTAIDKIIDKWTIRLIILFAVGIILPLIQLETDYNKLNDMLNLNFEKPANLGLAIDLWITTFCVLAIIPYLMKVNRTVKYDGGVPKLSEDAFEAIESDRIPRTDELVELGFSAIDDFLELEIKNIVNELINIDELATYKKWGGDFRLKTIKDLEKMGLKTADKELNATKEIIDGLQKVGLKSARTGLDGEPFIKFNVQFIGLIVARRELPYLGFGRSSSATQEVLMALREIGIKVADKKSKKFSMKFSIPSSAINSLREIGMTAIDTGLSDDTVSVCSFSLFEMGVKVAENMSVKDAKKKDLRGHFNLINSVVFELEIIANTAFEKDSDKYKKTCETSIIFLWVLGAFVKRYLPPHYAEDMASQLKKSDKKVIKELFGNKDSRKNAREFITECKQYVINNRDFIKRYQLLDELKAFEYPKLIDELKSFEELYDTNFG